LLSDIRSTRWAIAGLCGATLFFLYFFGLTRTGLLGPDEPRYADIGRAMAQTGDWITPRLWGKPWFEKPPLLYWMTALGFQAGLDADLAPRLPVALASIAFLVFFFAALRREFGERPAFYATMILATSAGWLAYSHVAVTDLPMSGAFAGAMLIVMRGRLRITESVAAGALLGLAILAKGLVPLALFVPALWFLRRHVGQALSILSIAVLIAAPWYVLVMLRNGAPFFDVFFLQQTFGRFASHELGHEQPFWFYLPVLLAGLFPWTPFLILLFRNRAYQDRRATFLLAWIIWALVFFSVFLNKLPGYLLPILPAAAALLGISIATETRSARIVTLLAASAVLLCFIPAIQDALPEALLAGFSRAHIELSAAWVFPALIVAAASILLERTHRREAAVAIIAITVVVGVIRLVWLIYPEIDRLDSARSISHSQSITCVPSHDRSRRYGLSYYANRELPDCN